MGGAFDCDSQACYLAVIYLDIIICTHMLYVLLAISVNSHTYAFQDRICLQKSLLRAGHLTVTLRLAS